jgi:hypothetical protein
MHSQLLLAQGLTVVQWSEVAQNLIGAAGGLGVIAALFYAARFWWDRRRWSVFARLIEQWARDDVTGIAEDLSAGEDRHEFQWLVANWMNEAKFSPRESTELMEAAITFGRSRVMFAIRPQLIREGSP